MKIYGYVQGENLENQKAELTAWLKEFGLEITEWFEEPSKGKVYNTLLSKINEADGLAFYTLQWFKSINGPIELIYKLVTLNKRLYVLSTKQIINPVDYVPKAMEYMHKNPKEIERIKKYFKSTTPPRRAQ